MRTDPNTKSVPEWRAPAWSWASWDYRVTNLLTRGQTPIDSFKPGFNIKDVRTVPQASDLFGQLRSVSLHIRAVLQPVINLGSFRRIYRDLGERTDPLYDSSLNMIPIGDMIADDAAAPYITEVLCMKFFDRKYGQGYRCLVLQKSEMKNEFRRIEIGKLWDRYFKNHILFCIRITVCMFISTK